MMTTARLKDTSGFTLVEIVITVAILGVVLGSIVGLVISVQQSYTIQRESVRAEETLRAAQLIVSTAMRGAGADPRRTGTPRFYSNPEGNAAFDNFRAVSDFNPADGDTNDLLEDITIWMVGDTLMAIWQAGGSEQAVALPIDSLSISYFAMNGTALTTTAQADTASRARVRLVSTPDPANGRVERTETWVYLRNSL